LWSLYLFAALLGFGGWSVASVSSPLVAEYFGYESHGIILGAITFMGTLGGAFGPLAAGFIYDRMNSYQLIFIICAIITAIGIGLLIFLKKPLKGAQNE